MLRDGCQARVDGDWMGLFASVVHAKVRRSEALVSKKRKKREEVCKHVA